MAKVKFSALLAEMRNKLNGSVFSRNRGGNYLRTKVTPLNPQTAAQTAARNRLTTFSQGWRSLTQSQRDAWNSAVGNFATTDIFGDLRNPTGLQLYVRLNSNIDLGGGAAILLPPNPQGSNALSSLALVADATGGTFDVTFAPTPVPAGHAMIIESTAGLSAGINNASAEFRVISIVAAAVISPQDVFAAQVAKFGALSVGLKYFIRVKLIRLSTGEVSQALISDSIAV